MWAYESVFYQIYPLGFCGAPFENDGIIDVEREGKYAVVEAYKSAYGDDVEFECRQVLNILSENMGFSGWEKMIHEINSIDTALYSGVILTHGSDTLAYTSAMLGMYFRHFDIPLFIIASKIRIY